MAKVILEGPAKADFIMACASRRQAVELHYRETLSLVFDPADSEALATMFETLAALVRATPAAMAEATDHTRPSDPPFDPMAN